MDHRTDELVLAIFQQKPFQAIHPVEFLFIEQETGSVDWFALDLRSPVSNGIEILECDSPRIDFGVTRLTGGVVSMILDALLQSELGDLGIGKIDLRNGWRWRRWRIVQQTFEHPDATLEWMRILSIGIHRQQPGLSHQAAAPVPGFQLHASKMVSKDVGQAIVTGKSLIGDRVISMNEIQHAVVVLQDFMKECDGLFLHRFF